MRLLLLAGLLLRLSAAPAPIGKAYDHFYNLEYDQAIAEFEKEIRDRPNDPFSYTHLAQGLLYRAMFKAGALESELVSGNKFALARAKILPPESDRKRFEWAIEKAIELCQARLAADARDTSALYALGNAHGLRSNYNFLVLRKWRDALREFTESRKVHDRALEINPNFVDAKFVIGVHDYIVGSLPWGWKLLGFLIGFRGDKDRGIETLEFVAANGDKARIESMILLAVAYRRERQAEKAVPLLKELIGLFPRNYLFRLELVQMYADLGKKDEALDVLRAMEQLKTSGAPGYKNLPGGKIYYSRGNLLFWYREYPEAITNLQRATALGDEAGLITLTNAWLRLGQCQDQLGNRKEALQAYNKAIAIAPDSDAAKEASGHLRSPYRRTG